VCVCVRAMFLMVWFCCRCVVSFLVSCFDDRRSYRHVVDLKGRRRKDAQLIKVHVNYSLDGCEVRARNGRPGDTKLNEAKHKNAGTEKGKAYKQLKLNFSPGWMATKTTPDAAIEEEPKEALQYVSGPTPITVELGPTNALSFAPVTSTKRNYVGFSGAKGGDGETLKG
jgi:hypothetical protein